MYQDVTHRSTESLLSAHAALCIHYTVRMHNLADLFHNCVLLNNKVFSQSKVVVLVRCPPAPVFFLFIF